MPDTNDTMREVLADLRVGRLTAKDAARRLAMLREPTGDTVIDPRGAVVEHLRALVAQHTATPLDRVRADVALDRYGFDSVMAIDVVRALEPDMGEIPVTTLFEVRSISDLADHLLSRYPSGYQRLVDRLAPLPSPTSTTSVAEDAATVAGQHPVSAGEDAARTPARVPVSVIGLAGRFPGAATVDEFWDVLAAGRDCISTIPAERWDWTQYAADEPGTAGTAYAHWGGFLTDVDKFDADFFRISPRQASYTDPQERLLLQEVWHALEDAALPARELAGRDVGVYVGVMYSEYGLWALSSSGPIDHLGSSYASIANRVSHTLDLRGPSMALDTMCSSSLTALDLACAALARGDIDTAIVAGVNLNLHPRKFVDLSQGRFAATDGRCRAFGAGGDGYVPGEAVVAAVLQRTEDAERSGRRGWGVVSGVAIGHGGRTNGFSTPNPADQERVIRRALAGAGVDAGDVDYVEAHGTGTALGDPIEAAALSAALQAPGRDTPCPIGSVKSNVGHCEAAAGLVGLTKVLLQMRHGALVPSLHSDEPNPELDLPRLGLTVQHDLVPWGTDGQHRRTAGLSSFGAGGASAHVIVQEPAPQPARTTTPASGTGERSFAFPLSAASEPALLAVADLLVRYLEDAPASCADVETTLWLGREHLDERCVVVATSLTELSRTLRELIATGSAVGVHAAGRGGPHKGLAQLEQWVAGGDATPGLPAGAGFIDLPLYPFQEGTYWVRSAEQEPRPTPPGGRALRLFATDRHIADHRVGGRLVVAAAVLLDAVSRAVRDVVGADRGLGSCVWLAPVVVDGEHVDLHVEVGDGRFAVRGADGTTHLEGIVAEPLAAGPQVVGTPPEHAVRYSAAQCYERFDAATLSYGPTYRVLSEVAVSDGTAWAQLVLSDDDPVAAVDGALQAIVGLTEQDEPPSIPFAMERVDLGSRVGAARFVQARHRGRLVDLRMADAEGRLVGSVTGLVVRPMRSAASTPTVSAAHLAERWQRRDAGASSVDADVVAVVAQEGATANGLVTALRRRYRTVVRTDPDAALPAGSGLVVDARNLEREVDLDVAIADYHDVVDPLVTLMAARTEGPVRLVELRRANDAYALTGTAVHRTLTSEMDRFAGRTVLVEPGAQDWDRLAGEVAVDGDWGRSVRLVDGQRSVAGLEYRAALPPTDDVALRRGGVYLVTGALGGVGRELCAHLAASVGARIVLVGRRPEPDGLPELLDRVTSAGGTARYVEADISTAEGARRSVAAALENYGQLDGVFHLAGVLRDALALRKRRDEADAVLGAKAAGAAHLLSAVAGAHIDLDVMVCFGSASAYVGVPGQVDYAYANAALSGLALQANRDPSLPRVVTLEWPLLDVPGMGVSAELVETLRRHLGWVPMPVPAAMSVIDDALRSREPVVRPVFGDAGTITQWVDVHLGTAHAAREQAGGVPVPEPAALAAPSLEEGVAVPRRWVEHLAALVGAELGLPGAVDPKRTFDRVGLESVMVMNLNRRLDADLGPVPATLFFQARNVEELANVLWGTHRDAVAALVSGAAEGGRPVETRPSASLAVTDPQSEPEAEPAPVRSVGPRRHGDVEPVAVIGLAGRYPGASDLTEFWALLVEGRDAVVEVGDDRWDHSALFDADIGAPGKTYARWGGLLDGIEMFDAAHFGISPREARQMDPQERLFLEAAWHAMEDAGYSHTARVGSRVGVFAGVMYAQYQLYGADARMQALDVLPSSQHAAVANRVSYAMDLHGPSMTLDTMCSSSLTALHLACQSLRAGESDMALAGGVNVISHPYRYLQMAAGRFASVDGRCRSFGAGGTGYVPGEGVGVVVLKLLKDAVADGDRIDAVLRGSALNHGGRTNGFTVPSVPGQTEVIQEALRTAGVRGDEIDYVEAHGTGTELGDPIEVAGLRSALGGGLDRQVAIGSVKSNIGHLESAAGIAALTKIVLQLRHGELVPSLHSDPPNTQIDLGPLRVQRTRGAWVSRGAGVPRRAAVSSFGAGGSNAHVVVEEYVAPVRLRPPGSTEVVRLSARTSGQLRTAAQQLEAALAPEPGDRADDVQRLCQVVASVVGVTAVEVDPDGDALELGVDQYQAAQIAQLFAPEDAARVAEALVSGTSFSQVARSSTAGESLEPRLPLVDVAHTLSVGRDDLSERLAVVASSVEELRSSLRAFVAGEPDERTAVGREARTRADFSFTTLLDGPEGERFVADLRAGGRLLDLARLWCAGHDVRWTAVGGRRVSLPGTPFERRRHWAPDVLERDITAEGLTEPAVPAAQVVAAMPRGPRTDPAPTLVHAVEAPSPRLDVDGAVAVIRAAMSGVLEVPVEELQDDVPHAQFGVDSVLAVEIVDRIETAVGVTVRPTDLFAHATIRDLAGHVVSLVPQGAPARAVVELAPAPRPVSAVTAPVATTPPLRHRAEVAVIGMAAEFPDAIDIHEFWDNLRRGVDSVREVPRWRWDVDAVYDADRSVPGASYSKWAGTIARPDRFDADFFGISPREAQLMDPQHRLLLQQSWLALEHAGSRAASLKGRDVPVFVGGSSGDYHAYLTRQGVEPEGYMFMGTNAAILSSRLSYQLDLRGASMTLDTSCSSSLLAIHLAAEAIREGRAELAVAGGAALLFTPDLHVLASKSGMLSPTGRCRAFDASADGFVPGEGVGAVVLKDLDSALRDGDRIIATIVGSGTNQDGRSNGLTAPNMQAQRELEVGVYREFDIDPAQIGYVECHGTGTRLGDPIELEALRTTFDGVPAGSCGIGSVKSNIGHALTASGLAGFVKTALCLQERELVPTLHVRDVNPLLELDNSPFYLTRERTEFPAPTGGRRYAAVSAFGFSGTNVHVVLGEAPPVVRVAADRAVLPVALSAPTAAALATLAERLAAFLTAHPSTRLVDVVHTFAHRRSFFGHRRVVVVADAGALAAALRGADGRPGAEVDELADDWSAARTRFLAGEEPHFPVVPHATVIELPATPLAADSHWPVAADFPQLAAAAPQRTVTLLPSNPLVADHVVAGRPVLPAAAHLSLVSELVLEVVGTEPFDLVDCVWMRPVVVEEPTTITIALVPRGDSWAFDVTSVAGDGEVIRHSRGKVHVEAGGARATAPERAGAPLPSTLDSRVHYHRFTRVGVRYGATYRTVRELVHGTDEVVARVSCDPADGTYLPPGLLDGAIQTVAALHADDADSGPQLPFAMDRVRVLRRPTREVTVEVRENARKSTITLRNLDGEPCVVIEAMSYRALPVPTTLHVRYPVWSREPLPAAGGEIVWPGDVVLLADHPDGAVARAVIRAVGGEVMVRPLTAPLDDGVLEPSRRDRLTVVVVAEGGSDAQGTEPVRDREQLALPVLHVVQALGAIDREIELVLVTVGAHRTSDRDTVRPATAQLVGLCRSARREHPTWAVQLVDIGTADVEAPTGLAGLPTAVTVARGQDDGACVLRAGEVWTQTLAPTGPGDGAVVTPPRAGGVHVVVGGARGVGFECAVDLVGRTGAAVALIGRRDPDGDIEERIRLLEALGGTAIYLQADVADQDDLARALAHVRDRLGQIRGVYHSAIVLRDAPIAQLTDERFTDVCRPKMEGLVNLAKQTAQDDLDHFVVFSSAQSFVGNAGQGNYAAASMYADAYVEGMRAEGRPVRLVSWGYWGDVGVVAHRRYRVAMEERGVGSIGALEGMGALADLIVSKHHQALIVRCMPDALVHFGERPTEDVVRPTGPSSLIDADAVRRLVTEHAEMERLALTWVCSVLVDAGVLSQDGDSRTQDRWHGVEPPKHRLAEALVEHLRAAGLMHSRSAPADIREQLVRLGGQAPAVADQVRLLVACLDAYPDLLAGRRDATEIIFPKSSMELVEGVYRSDPLVSGLNKVVAHIVSEVVEGAGRVCNVLEVGAGTGGTTSAVVPALAAGSGRVRYRYTDLSAAFLAHGRRQFGTLLPGMEFDRFDIALEPAGQGVEPGSQDVVLAANVLHATADLRATVEHVAMILRTGGRLVLLETTRPSPFATLTFGLLDGWWLTTDGLREPGSPLASVPTWERELRAQGFTDIRVYPSHDDLGVEVGQHVLVASLGARRSAPVPVNGSALPTSTAPPEQPTSAALPASVAASHGDVARQIEAVVARVLRRPVGSVDHTRAFTEYGIDSIILVELVGELNSALGVELGNTALFDHPTIHDLARHVVDLERAARPDVPDGTGPDSGHEDFDAVDLDLLEALADGSLTVDEAEALMEGRS